MAIKLTPASVRKQLAELRGQRRNLDSEYAHGQELIRIETEALQKRCPHDNLRPIRIGSKEYQAMCDARGDESSECLDCGASGRRPATVGQ